MTPEEVEKEVIELIYRKPFVPFVVVFQDGSKLLVPHPRLAINGGGATFFDLEGALVDIDFKKVRSLRVLDIEAVA